MQTTFNNFLSCIRTSLIFGFAIDIADMEYQINNMRHIDTNEAIDDLFKLLLNYTEPLQIKNNLFISQATSDIDYVAFAALQNHCIVNTLDLMEFYLQNQTSKISTAYEFLTKYAFLGYNELQSRPLVHGKKILYNEEKNCKSTTNKNAERISRLFPDARNFKTQIKKRCFQFNHSTNDFFHAAHFIDNDNCYLPFASNCRYAVILFGDCLAKQITSTYSADTSTELANTIEKPFRSFYLSLNQALKVFNNSLYGKEAGITEKMPYDNTDKILFRYRLERCFHRQFLIDIMNLWNNMSTSDNFKNKNGIIDSYGIKNSLSLFAFLPNSFSQNYFLKLALQGLDSSLQHGINVLGTQFEVMKSISYLNAQVAFQRPDKIQNTQTIIQEWAKNLNQFVSFALNIYFPCNEALFVYLLAYYVQTHHTSKNSSEEEIVKKMYEILHTYTNTHAYFITESFSEDIFTKKHPNDILTQLKNKNNHALLFNRITPQTYTENYSKSLSDKNLFVVDDSEILLTRKNFKFYESIIKSIFISNDLNLQYSLNHVALTLFSESFFINQITSSESKRIYQNKQLSAALDFLSNHEFTKTT